MAMKLSNTFVKAKRRVLLINRDNLVTVAVLTVILLGVYWGISPGTVSKTGINSLGSATTMVGVAAIGEAIIVLIGGFDLSVAAIIAVLNVIAVTQMHTSSASEILVPLEVCIIGCGISLTNGLLVVFARIPSIVVTLATSFVWTGIALLIMPQPGGSVPNGFSGALTGFVGDLIPTSIIILVIAAIIWVIIKHTKMGQIWYLVGSNREAATANGINLRGSILSAYVIAGLFYAVGSLFLTAQSASGNPDVSDTIIITIFAAVVIGGVAFGGGKGNPAGAVLGAFVITLIIQVLFVAGVSSFYTDIFDGIVLIIAVALTTQASLTKLQDVRWIAKVFNGRVVKNEISK